jgi:hypothetical protein
MPIHIVIGLISLLIALVLYSLGAWGAFRAQTMGVRSLGLIWTGFVFDVIATSMMAIQAGGLQQDLHTFLALIAMVGMLLSAVLDTWALRISNDKIKFFISRWILAPWTLWVFVFIWGMLERGSARLIH